MCRLRNGLLVAAANLLLPVGVVLFIVGFFRGHPALSILAQPEVVAQESGVSDPATFNKIIFMMVDALRSDFVYAESSGFEFTQSLIRSGAAVPFTARAASPTLTLSRVKALTQGTSQSFLDVWLNIYESESARSVAGADTWLSRLKIERDIGKKMVFYGAELWLDLYGGLFDRSEGTDSWYLPEFATVDSNVSRHLPSELVRDDWKALVLHYLGLDNIAHQGGTSGAHMLSKQAEMDQVVRLIYGAMEQEPHLRNTLFVLLGDHGLTEQGNHGGASPGEIASAMIFVSPKLRSSFGGLKSPLKARTDYTYYSVINQVDLVPTIAGLMNFTIPARSLGVFATDLLDIFHNTNDGLEFLLKNAEQLQLLVESEYGSKVEPDGCTASCTDCLSLHDKVICLSKRANLAQRDWRAKSSTANEMCRITRDFCMSAQQLLHTPPNNPSLTHLVVSAFAVLAAVIIIARTVYLLPGNLSSGTWTFIIIVALQAPTMFIDRLVIEEHHYWYWASIFWLAVLSQRKMVNGEHWPKMLYPVLLQLLSQSFDQGAIPKELQLYQVHTLLSNRQFLFWIPGLAIYVSALTRVLQYLGLGSPLSMLASATLCSAGIFFRLSSSYRLDPESFHLAPTWLNGLINQVNRNLSLNIFWAGLAATFIVVLIQSRFSGRPGKKVTLIGIVEVFNLYLRSLTRPEHLVLFPIYDLQQQWLLDSVSLMSPSDIAVTTLVLGQSAFYATGHSNSFSSFDLTNGFNGIESSRTIAVALQALFGNYFGPMWWSLASLRLLQAWQESALTTKPSPQNFDKMSDHRPEHGRSGTSSDECQGRTGVHNLTRTGSAPLTSDKSSTETKRTYGAGINRRSPFLENLSLQTLFSASSSLVVMMACVWKRNDPSMWIVLTPKCLNIVLWTCFQQLLVNFALCTGIWIFVEA